MSTEPTQLSADATRMSSEKTVGPSEHANGTGMFVAYHHINVVEYLITNTLQLPCKAPLPPTPSLQANPRRKARRLQLLKVTRPRSVPS